MAQNLSDFLTTNNAGSGEAESRAVQPAHGFADFLTPRADSTPSHLPALDPAKVSQIVSEEGASNLLPVVSALYGQESSSGANAARSVDGARGGMQILPDTFKRFAKPGESIDNPEDNLRVGARYVKALGDRFGNDPAKIAAGYFSGEGNVNPGTGAAFKVDHQDGNGKSVSSYVHDVVSRLQGSTPAASGAAPDLTKAPKWSAIVAKPGYQALTLEQQVQARDAYFDKWIAPNVPAEQRDGYRTWFNEQTSKPAGAAKPGMLDSIKSAVSGAIDGAGNMLSGLTGASPKADGHVMDDMSGKTVAGPQSMTPASPEFRAYVNAQWDAATPDERIRLAQAPGITGQLAAERNKQFADHDQHSNDIADRFDPRAELRARRLARSGMDPKLAGEWARNEARQGTMTGQDEPGTIGKTDFDFDAQKKYNSDPLFSNPAVRGAVKGYEGLKQGYLGLDQFVLDAVGADDQAAKMAQGSKESNNFTQAMGESGSRMQRNFEGAVSSIAQQIPALMGGAVTGSEPLVLGSMFAQTFGQEYANGRSQGQTTGEATTRAGIYGAFEVIGEKFGLGKTLQALRLTAKGASTAELSHTLAQAMLREIPGEEVTTLGQFLTDKLPGGVGLNTEAGLAEYLEQAGDTLTQTMMQSGLMMGGTSGVSAAVRHLRSTGEGSSSPQNEAEAARTNALAKWQQFGDQIRQSGKSVQPDGRVEPTLNPSPANDAPVAPAPAPASATENQIAPQDALDYGRARLEQLTAARDGGTVQQAGEDGQIQEVDAPGRALTESEQAELAALEQHADNPAEIAKLYGFDTASPKIETPVDQAAHEAASSPLNDKPQPTDAQKDAGNYAKGHVALHGIDIAIENPQGSVRSGTDANGKTWANAMAHHYGYIKRTEGADGDHVDAFIGPNPDSDKAFIVDQIDPKTGKFDEHKVMLGFDSQAEADAAYHATYEKGWTGRGAITEMPIDQFKTWLKDGDTTQPIAKESAANAPESAQTQQETSAPPAAESAPLVAEKVKPKTEKEARVQRAARAADAEGTLPPAVQDLITRAVKEKNLKPGNVRAELFRDGVVDAVAGKDPQQARTSYIEGHTWASEQIGKKPISEAEPARKQDNWIGADRAFVKQADEEHGPSGASQEALEFVRKSPVGTTALETIVRPSGKTWHSIYLSNGDGSFESAPIGAQMQGDLRDIVTTLEKKRDTSRAQQTTRRVEAEKRAQFELAIAKEQGYAEGVALGVIIPNTGSMLRAAKIVKAHGDGRFDVQGVAGNKQAIIRGMTASGIKQAGDRYVESKPKTEKEARKKSNAQPIDASQSATGKEPEPSKPKTEKEARARREAATKPAAPISDFGEKIGGARKDVWTSFKHDLKAVADHEIAGQPLSKIWPSPDYDNLIENGMAADAVAAVRALRDEIPVKPRSSWKVARWAEQVKSLRSFANGLMSGEISVDRLRQELARGGHGLRGVGGRIDLYLEVGHAKSLEGIRFAEHHFSIYRGQENVNLWVVKKDAKATAFSNWPREIATGKTKEEAIANFKKKFGELETGSPAKKEATFDIYSTRGENGYKVGKKVGRNFIELAGPFATVKEAREYKAAHNAELVAKLEKAKEIPQERRDTNEPRVGVDMRNGQDVTPQQFSDAFGFRGVEFGNYVEGAKRQQDLNDAFDALMDMAAILEIPPKAISLNGELGLAFGARGAGGKGAAAAHYERGHVVINLTKKNGAGSLGHEWWHALDNYFSRAHGDKDGMLTESHAVGTSSENAPYRINSAVRKEMIEAFGGVMKAIRTTAIKARSQKLDNKRTKEYWTTKPEMSARAFESYLISKLQDQNASNDYLANVVHEDTWKAAESLGFELDESYPYPTAGEIPAIRGAFDHFFQTVDTRETDKGTALYEPTRPYQSERTREAAGFIDQWEADDGMPVYYARGWALQAHRELDVSADLQPNGLPMGQTAFVDPGNKVFTFSVQDENGRQMANATLQINRTGEIVAIHDLDVKIKNQGLGTAIVRTIVASAKGPVRVLQIIPTAEKFWNSVGVHGQDTYNNGTIDWQSFSQSARGRAGRVAQDRVPGYKTGVEAGRAGELAARKTGYNPGQLSLDLDPYEHTETRDGTTDRQKDTGRAALEALTRRVAGLAAGRKKVSLLGLRLVDNFVAGRPNQLVGQVARTPADLAALAQVYRDPRFETFRVIYTKGNRVVGEAAYTSRLPGSVAVPQDMDARVENDKERFGADGYYVMHNHPSGRAAPSSADLRLTRQIAERASGFRQHIVIDHNEYAVIDAAGVYEVISDSTLNAIDFTANPALKHRLLGEKVTAPSEAVLLAKAMQVPDGHAALVLLSAEGKVQLLADVPLAALNVKTEGDIVRGKALVRRMARESGSAGARVLVLPEDAELLPYAPWIRRGVVMDVVSANGASLASVGEYGDDFLRTGGKPMEVRDHVVSGDTITIDGVERPRTNSEGKPIAYTTAGFEAFYKWFGDSTVVDDQGRPLVVYHGTSKFGFDSFDTYASNYGLMGQGGYFTADKNVAKNYTKKGNGGSPGIYETYLSISNPIDMDAKANTEAWKKHFDGIEDFHGGEDTNESWYRAAEEVLREDGLPSWEGAEIMQDSLRSMGFDGITHIGGGRLKSDTVSHRVFVAFEPTQIKSVDNIGTFNLNDARIMYEPREGYRADVKQTQGELVKEFGKPKFKNVDGWDKSVGTQLNKAAKNPHFKRVFDIAVERENAISLTAIRPSELAPAFLPRIDDFKSAAKTLMLGRSKNRQLQLASDALVAGTLQGESVLDGKVWSDSELRGKFGMDALGIAHYRQARAAIDASLDEVAAAEGFAALQMLVPRSIRGPVLNDPRNAEATLTAAIEKRIALDKVVKDKAQKNGAPEARLAQLDDAIATAEAARDTMAAVFVKSKSLKEAGYTPLMRFGKYTVQVEQVDPHTGKPVMDEQTGRPNTLYFGRFETEGEAQAEYYRQSVAYRDRADVSVKAGPVNDIKYRMYAGVSPETLALFAEQVGSDKVLHTLYQNAVSERSALKRRLDRKNIAGFSQDMPRVLANFITSNGRFAAQRYYTHDLNRAIKSIPRDKADVQKEAQKLKEFLDNPTDAGAGASSVAFVWFLGGNIASAAVNATQPVMMTAPYLSQWGTAQAGKSLAKAIPYALGKKEITDKELRAALKRGSQEGKVDAQEIFHLYSVGIQGVVANIANKAGKIPLIGDKLKAGSEDVRARLSALGTLWGMPFAMVEGFNRRLTFIAAWDVAKATGQEDPYSFAVRAVDETQGVYNKVNRPNWARSAPGRVIMTFSQYKIAYVELISRMWKQGGADGKKAAAFMVAVLILASGISGLPYADDVDDLLDTVGQFFGRNTNLKRDKRQWAYDTIGKTWGDMALYGVSSQLPFDVSGRLGLGNMLPGTSLLKPSDEQNRTKQIAELFGPLVAVGSQVGDAYDAAASGDIGKMAGAIAPTAIRNMMAGLDMAATGEAKDYKGRKVMDVTMPDAFWKGIGFNPTKIASDSRATMIVRQDVALHQGVESALVDMMASGIVQDKPELLDQAQAKLAEWNAANPETPIVISPQQIKSRVRQASTERGARTLKATPREMRGATASQLGLGD